LQVKFFKRAIFVALLNFHFRNYFFIGHSFNYQAFSGLTTSTTFNYPVELMILNSEARFNYLETEVKPNFILFLIRKK